MSKKREREGERICFSSFYFPSPGCCRSVLGARTIDLDNVFGYIDELVDEPLAVHFSQNAALVVIPVNSRERTKQKGNTLLLIGGGIHLTFSCFDICPLRFVHQLDREK